MLHGNTYLKRLEWTRCWRIRCHCRAEFDRPGRLGAPVVEGGSTRPNMVKLIRFLFVCAVILAIAGCGLVGITIWYFGRDLPDYQ